MLFTDLSLVQAHIVFATIGFNGQISIALIPGLAARENGGWRMPIVMASYLFGFAYPASFLTYRIALALGAG